MRGRMLLPQESGNTVAHSGVLAPPSTVISVKDFKQKKKAILASI